MSRDSRRHLARALLRWLEHFLATVGAVFLIYLFAFDLSVVSSGSMSPTLQGTSRGNGDWILTEKVSFRFREPRRWEVATFRANDGLQVMKRVVGLPDETVALRDNRILINGDAVLRPTEVASLTYYAYGNLQGGKEARCGTGYYVLGDDSRDSQDSRFDGPIDRRQIIGRAWLVVWPLSRIRFVNP